MPLSIWLYSMADKIVITYYRVIFNRRHATLFNIWQYVLSQIEWVLDIWQSVTVANYIMKLKVSQLPNQNNQEMATHESTLYKTFRMKFPVTESKLGKCSLGYGHRRKTWKGLTLIRQITAAKQPCEEVGCPLPPCCPHQALSRPQFLGFWILLS